MSDKEPIESIMRKFAELEGNVDVNYQENYNRNRNEDYHFNNNNNNNRYNYSSHNLNNNNNNNNITDNRIHPYEYEKENTLDYRRGHDYDYYRNDDDVFSKAPHEKDYNYDQSYNYNYNNTKEYSKKYLYSNDNATDNIKDNDYRYSYHDKYRNDVYDDSRYTTPQYNTNDIDRVTYNPSNYDAYLEDDDDEEDLYFSKSKKIKSKSKKGMEAEDWIDHQYSDNSGSGSEGEYEEYEYEDDEDNDYFIENERSNNTRTPSSSKKIPIKTLATNINTNKVRVKGYNPRDIDIDGATHLKLPPLPIPSTWASIVHNPLQLEQEQDQTTSIIVNSIKDKVKDIIQEIQDYPVQGILGRPPFSPDNFTISDWVVFMKKLLARVMPFGYLFVWVEREEMADVIRAAERELSFKYVENLCWIKKTLSNQIVKSTESYSGNSGFSNTHTHTQTHPRNSGPFFNSKSTLLILRKDPNSQCKLRHQRNGDCIFDFIGPAGGVTRWPDGKVYDVIETLLDGTKLKGPHLLHLWANNSPIDQLIYQSRHQWIRISESESESESV